MNRILSITAGAAGMYCGSCARDNAVARELIRRGYDVTLVPIYTPTRTDEPNVSRSEVLFGGISVYLQQNIPLFRKTPGFIDRLWDSPRVIETLAGRAVSNDPRMLGDLTVSMLRGTDGVLRKEFEKLLKWVRSEPRPDVINLPNSLLIALAQPLRHELGTPVCCTLQGEELFINGLPSAFRQEAIELIRRRAADVDCFIAVSHYCAKFMSEFLAIPREKIDVVPLGIQMDGYDRHRTTSPEFRVGYFARIAPEKGLHILADAYIRFRTRFPKAAARLDVAGYAAPAFQAYFDKTRVMLQKAGLEQEFVYRGVVDRDGKLEFLKNLDLLSVPATYDEPKGLFLLEAMASGVPVVQPRRGAFIEIVENTGGGILVKPDDPESLADGLESLWRDASLRSALANRAFQGVRDHYTVGQSVDRLLHVYNRIAPALSQPLRVNT